MSTGRWCGVALALVGAAAGASARGLEVVSASPQGLVEAGSRPRIQIVFSSPVVPLSQAQTLRQPPPWLTVTPPILARWRWAGTAELIGEPLAPLPRATTYTVRLAPSLAAVDGSTLGQEATFTFTTPLPTATIERGTGGAADAFPIVLTFDQPIDPGSLAERVTVRVAANPLTSLDERLVAEQDRRLAATEAEERAAWERFAASARGAEAATPAFLLQPDPRRPQEVFTLEPVGCWPLSANLQVQIAPGVRSLEGPLPSDRPFTATLATPWPFGPTHFSGRTGRGGEGFEPESVRLAFSADVTWRDIAPHLTYRERGETAWHRVTPFAEEWAWEWEDSELSLGPLGFGGNRQYEVCLDADAVDASGQRLGFPWCGTLATAHHAPSCYLVEGDGVVEWQGPHRLPLRLRNVTSYRLEQRLVGEEELVPLVAAREEREEAPLAGARSVPVTLPPDRSAVLPIELDPTLAGRPGIVLTRIQVESTVAGSEYDEDESAWLRQPRSCLTQVTSLGLTVKGSRLAGILVWVTELAEPRPVAGVTVTVRDAKNTVLWRGETDASGLARTPPDVNLARAYLLTARRGEDLAYARTSWWEGHRGWEFDLPVDYHALPPLLGHVWTDRGVVRPGESLHVKALVRERQEGGLALPRGGPFTFVIRGPHGDDEIVAETTLDPSAGAEVEIHIPATAPLGGREVLAGGRYNRDKRSFEGDQVWGADCSFRVAEFRRPKFRVFATTEKELVVAGDPVSGSAEARLLAGGVMAGAPVRWNARSQRLWWRPRGERWVRFETLPVAFLDEEELARSVQVAGDTGVLDEAGRFPLALPRAEALSGWPCRLALEVEVTDVDRQSTAATAAVTVLPGEFALGVERPPFFVPTSEGVHSAVVALAPDGTPQAGIAAQVMLLRRHWESVRRREVSGRYVFESSPVVEEVARTTVVTAAEPVPVAFEVSTAGEYALLARAVDRRGNQVESSTAFYVFGSGFAAWRFDTENRIELVPERDRFEPGETAHILVKSPWERATALVTVERAGVLEQRVEELVGTMPTVAVDVRPEYAPNVFVSVVLLRGRVDAPPDPELIDPGRPAYRVGYCELTVPPRGKRLQLAVNVAPEYRPGREATARLQVRGEDGAPRKAFVTVWAVDAGVLGLTAYRTPDPMATFYARRGLGVTTAESRSRVVGRRSYGTKGDVAGGGGGIETAGEAVRRDFRALAFWSGTIRTDASGEATVRFSLPDSLTTYRLMAVAAAGADEFGSAEREFTVTKPIAIEPALPRFLRPADKARAGIVVRNRTQQEQEVEVTLALAAGAPVELRGTATRVARVAPGASAEVGFGFVALAPGLATLTFRARSSTPGVEGDSLEVQLPIREVMPAESVATFFSTADQALEQVAVPRDVFPGTGGLTVRLAPTALLPAASGVRFLERYPYACAEQVASRLLGLTAALRLGSGFAPETIDGVPCREWLAAAVAQLLACQRSDGGFAFWPGGSSVEELSAFVSWALVEAERAGVAVERRALEAAQTYLSRGLRREQRRWGPPHDWTARVLLGFALERLGHPEPGYFQALFDTRQRAGNQWGRALLATTMLAVDRRDRRAAVLLEELANSLVVEARTARVEESVPDWGWWVFWSEPRSSAAALLARLAANPTDPVSERLARGLLDHLAHDRSHTTHATAWMLQALAAYRERHERAGASGTVEVLLGQRQLLAGRFSGAASTPLAATVPMAELQQQAAAGEILSLRTSFRGEGMVHGALELSSVPTRSDGPVREEGISLARRFLDSAGREVERSEAGQEVRLEVTVSCPVLRRFVAADVPIPAGLEALDPGLATTAVAADGGTEEDDTQAPWEPGFDRVEVRDDRVVLFATELPPGQHTFTVRCRATTAGTFLVAPGKVEEMYAPEVFGTTSLATFEVTPARR